MRNVMWLAALLVGLLVAESASAQNVALNASGARRTSNKIGLWDTSSLLSSPFRLTSLFASHHNILLPGGTNTRKGQLSPNDPKYLDAFGFKRLR